MDLRITPEDMLLFSKVSHDTNPLHMSADYARRTPFGEQVVFGILGTLAALQYAPVAPGHALASASIMFLNPMFVDVQYRVVTSYKQKAGAVEGNADGATLKIEVFDSKRRVLQGTFVFRALGATESPCIPNIADIEGVASRTTPNPFREADMQPELSLDGTYLPPVSALHHLDRQWQLTEKGITQAQIAALAWTSYVVGMEIPGEQAAYSRLEMKFSPQPTEVDTPYDYRAKLVSNDARFNLLRISAQLKAAETLIADAQIWAFLRTQSPKSSVELLQKLLPASDKLRGKVALVIGGSRGLGATLVQALAMQGCTVYLNYAMSHEDAMKVRNELVEAVPTAGEIRLLSGDATDVSWSHAPRTEIMEEHGGLDILICNASPAIRPLDFDTDTLGRFEDFVSKSLRLVAVPMAVFGEPLRRREGRYVVISSIYATTAPADFPHYVAAKCAIEGLVRSVISPDKPPYGMLVRPPKLLTDQTNTPMGKHNTLHPEQIAATVVSLLSEPAPSQELLIVENFASESDTVTAK